MKKKQYTIQTSCQRHSGSDRVNTQTGTIEELTQYFGYTLEIGNSYNKRINRNPKTIKSLENNLQKAYDEKEAALYNRTSVSVIPNPSGI